MRPLLVVFDEPALGDLLHLLDRFEDVGVEHLGAVRAVEALDEGVLVGLAGLNEAQLDVPLAGPVDEGMAGKLAPVVEAQRGGASRAARSADSSPE